MLDLGQTTDPLSLKFEFRHDLMAHGETFGGRLSYVIEDSLHGKFYQVGESEYRFLRLFEGRSTLQETLAQSAMAAGAAAFSQAEALTLVRWACNRQLLSARQGAEPQEDLSRTGRPVFNPFFIRLPIGSPQRWLEPWSRALGGMFSATGFALFAALWIGVLAYVLPRAQEILRWETLWHPQNWLGLLGIWLALKFWHELGHAVACRRFGGQIRSAGVALMCLAPVAYVDVTSAWRISSKWRRILVSAAGMYFEGWAAALALALAAVCHDEALRTWACHVALVAGGQTLFVNANPLVRFDGYYILADFLEIPNLSAISRQSTFKYLRRLSGDEEAVDAPIVQGRAAIAALYALATGVWRLFLVIAGCGVILSQQSILGPFLAWLLAIVWIALPLWILRRDMPVLRGWKPQRNRLALGGILLLFLLGGGSWWLLQPAVVRTEGIVEFSPVTVVRAPVPGFVRQVLVKNGVYVLEGAPLMVLVNENLELEATDLRLLILQSQGVIQALAAQQQLAERANEEANHRQLETKLHELEGQLRALTVRAPHAGQVLARNLEQMTGEFLASGTEVAVIGGEDSLQVLAVVAQEDWKAISERGQQAEVVMESDPRERFAAESIRFQPSALWSLPHEALSGVNGGPIPMRESAEPTADGRPAYQPLAPVFVAHVQLPKALSRTLHTGQRATVRFTCSGYSRAARLRDLVCRWFQRT